MTRSVYSKPSRLGTAIREPPIGIPRVTIVGWGTRGSHTSRYMAIGDRIGPAPMRQA